MAHANRKASNERIAKFCYKLAKSRYPGVNLSRVRFQVKPKNESFYHIHNGCRTVVFTIQVHMLKRDGEFNGKWMRAFEEGMMEVIDCLQNQVRCTDIMRVEAS